MTNQTKNSVIVRGVEFDNKKAGRFGESLGSVNEKLTIWSNAAALQYVAFDNNKWIAALFALDELRNVNGSLSAKGREVSAYIQYFAPIIIREVAGENANEKTLSISLTKNKRKKGKFATLKKDENEARILVDALESPDFPLDLREFCNMQKTEKTKADKPAPKASQLTGKVEKLADLFKEDAEKAVEGKAGEFWALAEQVKTLYDNAIAAMNEARAKEAKELERFELPELEGSEGNHKGEGTRADTDREKHAQAV